MTLAIFGGSFDPPHVAHVQAARYVLDQGIADGVIVVPVFAHALNKSLSPFDLRLEMCRRAFSGDDRVKVSDIESTLPRPSYTLHTVRAIAEAHPGEELRLIVGADVLHELDRWYKVEELRKEARLVVLGRAGVSADDAPDAVLPDVSSTEARTWWGPQVAEEARERRQKLIPASVRELIEERGLYRA